MSKAQKKLEDLERKQKEISNKLDKYEYDFNIEQKKANEINDFTFKNNNNNINAEPCANIDKDYQKVLDRRLDEIMGKINDNIINQNYIDFYNFLLKEMPKSKVKKSTKQKKPSKDNILKDNNISKKQSKSDFSKSKKSEKIEECQNIKKENEIDNLNDNNIEINNSNNNINNYSINTENDINNNNININNRLDKSKDLNKDNNNINTDLNNKNNINQIKKANIHISYNPLGNINLENIQNQQKLELLHKQQNIFLGNELTLLKIKLNKIRKENEFLQSLIHEKGMVKNTNVLEKFIGGFVEKLSLNWNEIVENIIDEIIIDEIHELNEIELNKVNYEKNKNILIKNLYNAGFGGIIPEEQNTYANLLIGNVEQIKKILNSVKESENNIKAKYNI